MSLNKIKSIVDKIGDSMWFDFSLSENNITIVLKKETFKLSKKTIKSGDLVFNPISNVILLIDDEDDIKYVNDNYWLIK